MPHRRRTAITPQAIERATTTIRRGGLVAFPTETVYGLGAGAFNEDAVAMLFEVKRCPLFHPLIVYVASPRRGRGAGRMIGQDAVRLMERFWPGALTLVLRKSPRIPEIVTAGLSTVAVRIPAHPAALALIGGGLPLDVGMRHSEWQRDRSSYRSTSPKQRRTG